MWWPEASQVFREPLVYNSGYQYFICMSCELSYPETQDRTHILKTRKCNRVHMTSWTFLPYWYLPYLDFHLHFQRCVGSAFIVMVQSLSLYKSTHTILFWYFIYGLTICFPRFEVLVCSKEVSKMYKLTLEICEKNMQLR